MGDLQRQARPDFQDPKGSGSKGEQFANYAGVGYRRKGRKMKPLLIALAGCVALYALAWLWFALWDYVPLFPALITFGLIVGLPVALFVWLWRNLT